MAGTSYNCLIAGLPEITWEDRKLTLSVQEFRELTRDYIKGKDAGLLDLFFLPNDNQQILRLLNKKEPDTTLQTVYPLKQLEDALLEPAYLPSYLSRFIVDFQEEHLVPDIAQENVLSWMYYDHLIAENNKLVTNYARFSMNLKNLITAINCRKYGKDIEREIIGDNEFSNALKTVGTKDFGLSMDYPYVEKIIALMENDNLVERERGIDLLLWDFLDEAVIFEYFSVEKVISFMLKLMIVERWSKMNSESGRKVFMEMVNRLQQQSVELKTAEPAGL